MLDALVCSGDLSGASVVENQRGVLHESVNNASATTFNIDYSCRIGIGRVRTNQNAQMAWLLFINVQHRQLTTRYELSFAKTLLEHFTLTNGYCVTKVRR